MRHIEKGWNAYKALLPKEAGEVQIKETRQAFYAGAAILLESLGMVLDPGTEPTEADMQRMIDIDKELREFGRNLDSRYLGLPRQN